MTPATRLTVIRGLAYLPLAGAVAGGCFQAWTSVSSAERDTLRAETFTAAEVARRPDAAELLDALFGRRWSITAAVDADVDEAVVDRSTNTGRAAVYDADSWFRTGTLELRPSPTLGLAPPSTLWLAAAAAAVLLIPLVRFWCGVRRRRPAFLFPALAAAVIVIGVGPAERWAASRLQALTTLRVDVASNALETLLPEGIVGRPGGVYQLTGLPFLLRAETGEVQFSSLATAVGEELARRPAPFSGRITAERITYEVRDVGPVRLAFLPYSHTGSPATAMVVMALVGLALSSLPTFFAPFVDQPRALRRHLTAMSFLAPSMAHLAVFTAAPLVAAAWLSMHRWSLLDQARPFVALANYWTLLGDDRWWNAVWNTAVFTLHVPFSMAIALAVALLVQRRAHGVVVLRALFFLPTITSLVAIAIVWQWMLHPEYGLFNWMLSAIGLPGLPWLTSTKTALLSIMLMSAWMVVGYQMILFLAGLAAIPTELYDAARIDGAGAWHRFLHVTIPGLRHTLFFVLITSVIGSFQMFGAVYVMTEGGPLRSTDVAVFHIYVEAWEFLRFGNAAAMSWILFAIVFVVTWVQFRTLERRAEGEA